MRALIIIPLAVLLAGMIGRDAIAQDSRFPGFHDFPHSRFEAKVHVTSAWMGHIHQAARHGFEVPERLHQGTDVGLRLQYAVRRRMRLFAGASRGFMGKHASDGYRRRKLETGGVSARPELLIFPGTGAATSYTTDALEIGVHALILRDRSLTPYVETGVALIRSSVDNDRGNRVRFQGVSWRGEVGMRVRLMRQIAVDVGAFGALNQYTNVTAADGDFHHTRDAFSRGVRLGLALSP